jgi:hypothetical protein
MHSRVNERRVNIALKSRVITTLRGIIAHCAQNIGWPIMIQVALRKTRVESGLKMTWES